MKAVAVFTRVLVSVLLLGLAAWLVPWSMDKRLFQQRQAGLPAKGPEAGRAFPEVQYLFGRQAFLEGRLDAAAGLLDQALSRNIVYIDAWLKRAEVEVQRGELEPARRMLMMVAGLTQEVLRWKWDEALLARESGLEDVFTANLNTLITEGRQVNDALWLMETHVGQDTGRVLEKLLPENREAYLAWLMRWRRAGDAIRTWQALDPVRREDETLRLSFIHFLIGNGNMALAQDLWLPAADGAGITNPGFEAPLTRMGFDWRFSGREGEWRIQQTSEPVRSGAKALEIRFSGEANSNFSHAYQFVPVSPGAAYRLSFWWKAHRLSSDKGVFVEVFGKDCREFHAKGPMILGTEDWRQVDVEFQAPEDCRTAVVRFRREESMRFDNKINGALWLDDFVLQNLENLGAKK
jgi:tetratricopeptide (TPR) repeat protein